MNTDKDVGAGFGHNGTIKVMSTRKGVLQPDLDALNRITNSLMRGIAMTGAKCGDANMLETVKRLYACGQKAYSDNDPEGLERAYDALKGIRLY